MLSDIAMMDITTFVDPDAQIWTTVVSFGLIGHDGMICSQKNTSATKKLECTTASPQ